MKVATRMYKDKEVFCFKSIYENAKKGNKFKAPVEDNYTDAGGEIYRNTMNLLRPIMGFENLEHFSLMIVHNPQKWESLQSVYNNFHRTVFKFVLENQDYLGIKSANK